MFPPRILAQFTLVKSFEQLMEKTWHSSSEKAAVTSVWAVKSRETALSNSAWSFTYATEPENKVSFI
jgi:hypothetical protein